MLFHFHRAGIYGALANMVGIPLTTFITMPLIALTMILFIIASAIHMKIGMQVVIEDYVQNEKLKLVTIMANNFFSIAVALAPIFAIIKLSSGV